MGWFSSFCSGVASVARSVVSGVSSAVSSAWSAAKTVASKTVGWLADKAENFIGAVKDTWVLVKPFIEQITPWVDRAADVIPWPWLKYAVKPVLFMRALKVTHFRQLDDPLTVFGLEGTIFGSVFTLSA